MVQKWFVSFKSPHLENKAKCFYKIISASSKIDTEIVHKRGKIQNIKKPVDNPTMGNRVKDR